MEIYINSNYAGSIIDHRSTTYGSSLCRNLITWRSKKQAVVSHLSAEAELWAMVEGICEGTWIKGIF